MTLTPPEPQSLGPGGIIRFAIGDPSSLRSNTWSVVGSKSNADVYVAARMTMGTIKLSLHASQIWRLALTEESSLRRQLGDADRVVARWTAPTPLVEGWQRATSICIPSSSLQAAWQEPRVKRGGISFWPVPTGNPEFVFDVFIRSSDARDIALNGIIGEVGRIRLGGGGDVWIVASESQMGAERLRSEEH